MQRSLVLVGVQVRGHRAQPAKPTDWCCLHRPPLPDVARLDRSNGAGAFITTEIGARDRLISDAAARFVDLHTTLDRGDRVGDGTAARHPRHRQHHLHRPFLGRDPEIPLLVDRVPVEPGDLHRRIHAVVIGEFRQHDLAKLIAHHSVRSLPVDQFDLYGLGNAAARTERPVEVAEIDALETRGRGRLVGVHGLLALRLDHRLLRGSAGDQRRCGDHQDGRHGERAARSFKGSGYAHMFHRRRRNDAIEQVVTEM